MRTLLFPFTFFLGVATSLGDPARGQPPAREDPAVAAARARQEKVKTIEVEFTFKETYAKGALSEMSPMVKGPALPAEETKGESTNRLVIDGTMVRYEKNHPQWHTDHRTLENYKSITVVNDSAGKMFYPNGLSTEPKPSGIIWKTRRVGELHLFELSPITAAFRGLDPNVAPFFLAELKPTGASVPIGGSLCTEYVRLWRNEKITSYWMDSNKDFLVRRITIQPQARWTEQIDITYRLDDGIGWVPASWSRTMYSKAGAVLVTSKVDVVTLRINQPQKAEQFDFSFPPETSVFDQRDEKFYRVKADGSMRELSKYGEELGGSVSQPGQPWYRRNQWLLVSFTVIGLAGLLVLIIGRVKPKSHAGMSARSSS